MLSLDHCKNLAYYLLTTNYAPYQNEKSKHLFDNINNGKSSKTRRKPLSKHPTTANTTNSVTVNISSYGDNSLPVLSKHTEQKKHYNFLIKMLKRDSLLPESLWNNVYNQLCDNFVYELNSSHRNFHQFTSTSAFFNYIIQYLGRSFSLKHNIIQLTDIGLSEPFKHNNIESTSVSNKLHLVCVEKSLFSFFIGCIALNDHELFVVYFHLLVIFLFFIHVKHLVLQTISQILVFISVYNLCTCFLKCFSTICLFS
uniref:SREBP regulating gene protein n=1 Tax=Schistosoma mansoni TaxID=6183 RepID=A0A5K4FEX4_SCHMA